MGSLASQIDGVTVYARGARVVRVATVPRPAPGRVVLADLPLALVDDSVRVEVRGPAIATEIRVSIDAPATAATAGAEEPDDLRAARRRHAIAVAEGERLAAALDQLARTPLIARDESDAPAAAWDAVVAARTHLVAVRAARELALREHLATVRADIEASHLAVALAEERVARASSARAARWHELRKAVAIELVAGDGDAAEAGAPIELRVEYLVGAARWAPSYVARLADGEARLELRAVVAQRTGEDWTGAALVLSTAEPATAAQLPELAPQRIGRRQDPAPRAGFRAPPTGAEALYADYDRGRGAVSPPVDDAPPEPVASDASEPIDEIEAQVWDEGSSRSKEAFATPPHGIPIPQAAPMVPMPAAAAKSRSFLPSMPSFARGGGGARSAPTSLDLDAKHDHVGSALQGGAPGGRAEPLAAPSASTPRLDYGDLRMPAPTAAARGRLAPAPRDAMADSLGTELGQRAAQLAALALPPGCADAWAHAFDFAFAADGRVDVASDGAWHALAVTARPASVTLRHVAVPRAQADVFRVAAVGNPFDGPLLPGPIDVYDRGEFLVTSSVDATPAGGAVEVGLGVDPQVKIARTTEFREEATGVLRGGLRLAHAIAIEVENHSTRAIQLEVRERVPVGVPGDDDVEVAVTRVEPPWERWSPEPDAPADARLRGGHRWSLALAAGAKATLRASYEVKIPSKLELVGGNRRES